MRISGYVGNGKSAYVNYASPKAKQSEAFAKLWNDAYQAGLDAVAKANVTPMTVRNPATGQSWFVADGVCGFAWVTVKPATSAFARWAKQAGLMSAAYGGGVKYWVGEFNQSMQKKEVFAAAVAAKLRDAGITAYSDSRMD